jgi:hypothetical protein
LGVKIDQTLPAGLLITIVTAIVSPSAAEADMIARKRRCKVMRATVPPSVAPRAALSRYAGMRSTPRANNDEPNGTIMICRMRPAEAC